MWATCWQPSAASTGSHLENTPWNNSRDSLSPPASLLGTHCLHFSQALSAVWQPVMLSCLGSSQQPHCCVARVFVTKHHNVCCAVCPCAKAPQKTAVQPWSTKHRSVELLPLLFCSTERPEPCRAAWISELCLIMGRVWPRTCKYAKLVMIMPSKKAKENSGKRMPSLTRPDSCWDNQDILFLMAKWRSNDNLLMKIYVLLRC